MAKGVGLDPGEHSVKVVEIDGSLRKVRLAKVRIERVAANGDAQEHAKTEAQTAWHAFKDAHVSRENLTLAVPCREAVLRTLTLPFVGAEQIRKVVKFEAESEIHSHNVDDMVVDFHVLEEDKESGETKALVAAVPKSYLRVQLQALDRAGLDPESVDLDLMALYRVAHWCGALTGLVPGAEPAAEEADAAVAAPGRMGRLVLDIGARTTRAVVTVDGAIVDMRGLRLGVDSIAADVAAARGVTLEQAREVVVRMLAGGEEEVYAVVTDEPATAEELEADTEAATTALAPIEVPAEFVRTAQARFLADLRRELLRFLAGIPAIAGIELAWVTGGGSRLPELHEMVTGLIGGPCLELDVLGSLSHSLPPEEAAEVGPRIAVAVGLALRPLGASSGFEFRTEDLAFTKKFDRIKFPLAITAMLALFLTVVYALKTQKELVALRNDFGATIPAAARGGGRVAEQRPEFSGYVGTLLGRAGWFSQPKNFDPREYNKLLEEVEAQPVFKRLALVRERVRAQHRKQQTESGIYQDLKLGSGLGVLAEMAKVIQSVENKLGRFLVTDIHLRLEAQDANRSLSFRVAVRGQDYTSKYVALENAFAEAAKDPKSAFLELGKRMRDEEPFTDSEGPGAFYELRMVLKPEKSFPAYP